MIQKSSITLLDVVKAAALVFAVGYLVRTVTNVQSKYEICGKFSVTGNVFLNAFLISYGESIADAICDIQGDRDNDTGRIRMGALKREISLKGGPKEQYQACPMTDGEYELLSRLVAAEAENQSFEAQYMIACVVENRVRSEYFPDTLTGVIWQSEPSKQFSAMWDGRYGRCSATRRSRRAVRYMAEHGNRLPEKVLYFTSCGYLSGTEPYRQVDNIYFSCREGME